MITHGDVLDVLQGTPDETYSGCFCDPPYGLSFMGKRWDHGVPSCEVWREVWRVLRPGAVLMAFGGTRTWHRLAVNIEDAGFEMFDTLMWIYGSGFPKSQDIGKAIDREAGQEREVVGSLADIHPRYATPRKTAVHNGGIRSETAPPITAPATDAARTWQGYGTALKPAHEPVLLFRKPRKGTYAATALQHGTGALWVDGCRVGYANDADKQAGWPVSRSYTASGYDFDNGQKAAQQFTQPITPQPAGRWPSNVILDDEAGRLLDQMSGERPSGSGIKNPAGRIRASNALGQFVTRYDNHGIGGDTGGASRFFYCAKSSRAEREAGLEGLPLRDAGALKSGDGGWRDEELRGRKSRHDNQLMARNNHPCVKPLALTEYLARLIVPPVEYRDDARLLVPFCGSGSEMIGAYRAGWLHVDGIDNEAGYIEIAERRIAHELSKLEQFEQQLRLI